MNYYNEIKNKLIDNEITKRIKDYSKNKSDLTTYYNVGKLLSEAGKHYGEGIIKEYSKRLSKDIGKGYGISNLKRMRQFYYLIEKGALLAHQLSWSHYVELLPINNICIVNYYIELRGGKDSPTKEFFEVKPGISFQEFNKYINNV